MPAIEVERMTQFVADPSSGVLDLRDEARTIQTTNKQIGLESAKP
jgi:hypothetical protein